jgi:hypothetical protein
MSKLITVPRPRLTEPLETVTAFFATFLLLTVALGTVLTLVGPGSFGGFGNTRICVTQPNTGYNGPDWASHLGVTHRPGTTVDINGTLQACALHPGIGQRMLYTLMSLPGLLVWAAVLLLLWRIIRAARQTGPFTVQAAAAMRRLGWLIIAGTAAAGVLQGFAQDRLINTMLTPSNDYGDALTDPIRALLPVPVLAGAALLSFARIIQRGAEMDAEIKATV